MYENMSAEEMKRLYDNARPETEDVSFARSIVLTLPKGVRPSDHLARWLCVIRKLIEATFLPSLTGAISREENELMDAMENGDDEELVRKLSVFLGVNLAKRP